MRAATGDQYELIRESPRGRFSATIVQLAAGIREFQIDGVDLVEPYESTRTSPKAAGTVLCPWPGRVRDGRWIHEGRTQQLDITEPHFSAAAHGLLQNTGYVLVDRTADSVMQAATVYPQHGYGFLLDTTVTHTLTDEGLAVLHTVRNSSRVAAPVALGAHSYLTIGGVPPSQLTLTVRAATELVVDDQRIPIGDQPVAGTTHDLNGGVRLSRLDFDVGLTDLDPEARHGLAASDGRSVMIWGDEWVRYLQVSTPHDFPARDGMRQAVAIKPMTAPANALASGRGLVWLEPDEEWAVRWGIAYSMTAEA